MSDATECTCQDIRYEQLPSGEFVVHGKVCDHCKEIQEQESR